MALHLRAALDQVGLLRGVRAVSCAVGAAGGRRMSHSQASVSGVDEAAVQRLVLHCRLVAEQHGTAQRLQPDQVAAHVRVLLAEGVGEEDIKAVIKERRRRAQRVAAVLVGLARAGAKPCQTAWQAQQDEQVAANLRVLLAAAATNATTHAAATEGRPHL